MIDGLRKDAKPDGYSDGGADLSAARSFPISDTARADSRFKLFDLNLKTEHDRTEPPKAPRQRPDVYAPRGGCGLPRPVVVFFYGGSWNSGTRTSYAFVGRTLAVDPRWLGETRSVVRGFVGLAGPYDVAPFDVDASRAAFGQVSDPAETQPVTWAGTGDSPALLLYGTEDTVVRPRNSIALAGRLRAGGVTVEQRAYSKRGHVGILLTLARPFRGRGPVLAYVARFIRSTVNPNDADRR